MKELLLSQLETLERDLLQLKKELKEVTTAQVSRQSIRSLAEQIATFWVEKLRSPLEHKAKLPADVVTKYAELFKRLHILSRPNNRKKSYTEVVGSILKHFKDDLILPVQQLSEIGVQNRVLAELIAQIPEAEISDYLNESIMCAHAGYFKASIVMGWCAAIDCIQQKVLRTGFDKFNETSRTLKAATTGRFRRFNKEFKVASLNELQEVFDNDLIWIIEGMGLIDSNEAGRLQICFQWRNNSAHPGYAPILEVHLNAFFTDIVTIVLANPKFTS